MPEGRNRWWDAPEMNNRWWETSEKKRPWWHVQGSGGSIREAQDRLVADRYRLVRELGRGGMGVVWLADDLNLGRKVAVKELRPPQGLAGADLAAYQQRALREARSAAQVSHANAVIVHDSLPSTAEDQAVYLIMEFIDGPTLTEVVRREGALAASRIAGYGLQLLDVLAAAHALGIVHRDVKPGNIMIAPGDQVKLTDFGIAHTVGDPRLTHSGVAGTEAYMAPELSDSEPITPAADLWSLGATLYFAAEGHSPFDRGTAAATLRAIQIDDLPVPHCEAALAAAISGLLQRAPAQRFTVEQARRLLALWAEPPTAESKQILARPAPATAYANGHWLTLTLSPEGIVVQRKLLREVNIGWNRVSRIGPGKRWSKRALCAWVPSASAHPRRKARQGIAADHLVPVRIFPLRSRRVPIDTILTAIRSYCPTVTIEPP